MDAAFDLYETVAASYAKPRNYDESANHHRDLYKLVESARDVLRKSLGYPRVTDHLGEYCNLHERDIPGHRYATMTRDGLSYSGWYNAVSAEKNAEMLAAHEARSAELRKWFQTPAVERFVAGDRVSYRGMRETVYVARYVRNAAAPCLKVHEVVSFFDRPHRMSPIMSEPEARSFFANLDAPFFTAHCKDV